MIKKGFLKKLNNEKGVAAVLVLAVILVLTALGTIALVASAANISMGSKSRVWSKDYYTLDSQAEFYVQQIDNSLSEAENNAREYVQNKYYETTGTAITATLAAVGITSLDIQKVFHDQYMDQFSTGGAIFTLDECIADPARLGPGVTAEQAEGIYTERIKNLNSEIFNTVYFYIASNKLDALVATPTCTAITLKQTGGLPCTTGYRTRITDTTKDWTAKQPSGVDLAAYIKVKTPDGEDTKRVEAEIRVIVPDYEIVLQKINMAYQGNPIWANAISAEGEIRVESNHAVIKGDVYDSGTGINILTGAAVGIYGNVYTAGDLHVSGNSGSLRIYSHDTAGASAADNYFKKKIYDNGLASNENGTDVYFDKAEERAILRAYTATSSAFEIDSYMEGQTTIPLLFNDSSGWGNVYCKNLTVDEGVMNSSIKVDGNIWTSDDIEMNGKESTIEAGQNTSTSSAIGLQTDSDFVNNNPGASSSIINNYPEANSKIILNGNIVVPGVAFYDFESGPVPAIGGHVYYKTPESVSAKVTSPAAIFNAYTTTDTSIAPFEREGGEYYLTTPSAITEDTLKTFVEGKGLQTNIITGSTTPSGYVVKSSITQKDPSSPAVSYKSGEIQNSGTVFSDFTTLINSGVMMDIFNAKTKRFGLNASYGARPFEEYVNSGAAGNCPELLILDGGDHEVNVDEINQGIIYSKGNLTITGTGGHTFNGSIICEKDVTIRGNVTIVYNESVITDLYSNYAKVRSFFSPGAMGSDNYYQDYSTQSGTRTVPKRYKIMSWKEIQD